MRFKQLHPRLIQVNAQPYSQFEHQETKIEVITEQKSPLMVGTVVKNNPNFPDLEVGKLVLFSIIDRHNTEWATPIGQQKVYDEGEYLVDAYGCLALLEEIEAESQKEGDYASCTQGN